jgi:methionyl aminopeptidase
MSCIRRHFHHSQLVRKRREGKSPLFGNYQLLVPNLTARHEFNSVPAHIKRPDYSNVAPIDPNAAIHIHSELEIQGIEHASQIAKTVLELACSTTTVGMTTLEIDELVHMEIIKRNGYPSPLHYQGFPKSVCTSINNVLCHGIPDGRKLLDGDIINIDITVYFEGFHGDTSRTIGVGNVDKQGLDLIQNNKSALELTIETIKPGESFSKIGQVIHDYADRFNYSVDQNFCGHGIGKLFHQPPLILHYRNNQDAIMKPGMVFTIEPIFCQGSMFGYLKWPDGWTVVSKDGSRSAQHEHTILVTESGSKVLTG